MRHQDWYIRDVPPEVSDRLSRLAASSKMSVSAFVWNELTEVARRADNPALLDALPDLGFPPRRYSPNWTPAEPKGDGGRRVGRGSRALERT